MYDGTHGEAITTINYGILEKILVCGLGRKKLWGTLQSKTLLLAVITPFKTNGENAAVQTTHYKTSLAAIVTDISNVKSSVGRVETRGQFGLIDWDVQLVCPTFSGEGDSDESDDDFHG